MPDPMYASQFLSIASPLLVDGPDGPTVLLAFVIATDGELLAMTVGHEGGRVSFPSIVALDFPSPISLRTVASGSENLNRQQRRHGGDA